MPSIRASRLSYAYEGRAPLFEGASFHLSPGLTGLVGENGSGKTTLLRLLSGELPPTDGELVTTPEDARVVVCSQTALVMGPEVAAFAGDESRAARRLRGTLELDEAGLARWETLSPGERKRWQVGAALLDEPDVLLLDEPTNHLDEAARRVLSAALARFGGVGVIVSHDREALAALTGATLRVHRGTVRLFPGDYDAARASWQREDDERRSERDAWVAEARSLSRLVADKHRAHASAQAGLSSRSRMKDKNDHDARGGLAKGRAEAAERKIGRDVSVARERLARASEAAAEIAIEREVGRTVKVRHERSRSPRLAVLDRDEITAGETTILRDVRLTVGRDDRIWVRGANGAGKSTLLAALAASSPGLWYVPQELGAPPDVRGLPPDIRGQVLSMVAALGLSPERLLATSRPSPGEARKLAIAFGLGTDVAGVALDEPTNHLDLPSIERLEAALDVYPGALVLITHDARLAARLTRTTWHVEGGTVVAR